MRQCGGCTLCCKLIPVEELKKPAGARCQHVRSGKGCAIYERRPSSCREWSCMWLVGVEGDDFHPLPLGRPDRVHYVIDMVPDLVRTRSRETGDIVEEFNVMQIWVDPLYPDAWQDKALLDMLERQGIVALIRYNSREGFAVLPPSRSASGKWERSQHHEVADDMDHARRARRFDFFRQQLNLKSKTPSPA